MKKFLTVLIVIAVMFTFSFSSAFAAADQTVEYGTKGDVKELRLAAAYTDATGKYGVTEAYKEELVELVEAIDYETDYYVPEQATAKAAVEKAIADIKAATTAVQAKAVYDKLTTETLAKLNKTAMTTKYGAYSTFVTALADEITFVGRSAASTDMATLDGQKYVLLEGYDYFKAVGLDARTDKFSALTEGEKTAILDWMFDNNYRTVTEMKAHMADVLAAMKPVTNAYTDAMVLEFDKLDARVTAFGKKLDTTGYKATISIADLEVAETLIDDVTAFNSKYCADSAVGVLAKIANAYGVATWTDEANAHRAICYAANLFLNQYYAQIEALPAATRLTEADKATVIDLSKKVAALEDEYATKYDAVKAYVPALSGSADVENKAKLTAAVNEFKTDDAAALAKLFNYDTNKDTAFSVTIPGVGSTVVFDASEDNLSKLAAAKKAYDEYVANYDERKSTYEAQLLAAEWNKDAAAGYDNKADKLENSKVQAYLNNATVKVTTKALGNNKIRVNATIDAQSFDYILKEMTKGCTVEYQFYHKTAAAKTYKASTVKDRNYITYTSKSLKKGTKYKFQCSVIIKDADGNVVATKDYKASTIGSRVCR